MLFLFLISLSKEVGKSTVDNAKQLSNELAKVENRRNPANRQSPEFDNEPARTLIPIPNIFEDDTGYR